MGDYVIPLDDPAAADADCVGPKAANLAALALAGLPTPGGFCLTRATPRWLYSFSR
jgi:phosphoenolpyruvate synthase/pyruvate phosphate dikinase